MHTGAWLMSQGLESKVTLVTPEARVSFFEAWDVTPDEQVALEEIYAHQVLDYGLRAVDTVQEISSQNL